MTKALIETTYENVTANIPALGDTRFVIITGRPVNGESTPVTPARIEAAASSSNGRRARAGAATIKRTLVTESLLRATDSAGRGTGENDYLGQLDELNGRWLQGVSARELRSRLGEISYSNAKTGSLWEVPPNTKSDAVSH